MGPLLIYNMKSYHSFKVQVQQQNNNLRSVDLAIAIYKFKCPFPRDLYPSLKIAINCFGMFVRYIHKNYSGTKIFSCCQGKNAIVTGNFSHPTADKVDIP